MAELYGDLDALVTGEAVSLDLPPAPLGLHVVSTFIDILLAVVVLVVGFWTTVLMASDDATLAVGSVVTLVVALIGVPTAVETLTRGRSLGKLATGLRTVRDDAGPITFQHAFTRALIGLAEIWALSGVPAFIAGLVSPRGKRIGDYAAGTYVIRSRVALSLPPPVLMPPPLAGWARTADIAPLPERLLLAIRQVLGRSASLAPQTRSVLVQRLATELATHVSPAPPPGTPPEAFIAAVVAEHRDRDAARIAREQALIRRLGEAAQVRRR